MKPKHLKDLLVKIIVIGLVLLVAPLMIPYAIELVVMLDIAGLEAVLVLLLLQAKPIKTAILMRFKSWQYHFGLTVLLISAVYMFQTDIFMLHTLGSVLVILCTWSLLAALAVWLPAIYLSHTQLRGSYLTIPLLTLSPGAPESTPRHGPA